MDFSLQCPCGNCVTVSESAAEGTVDCPCGRTIAVPSLKEMRVQAGLPPYHISPETLIEHLLPIGQLPGSKICVQCGAETDHSVQVLTECERAWTHTKADSLFWMKLCFDLLSPLMSLLRYWETSPKEKEYGKDKVYSLPLPICPHCLPMLRGRKKLIQGLHKIPEYSRLLDKFPGAAVTIL